MTPFYIKIDYVCHQCCIFEYTYKYILIYVRGIHMNIVEYMQKYTSFGYYQYMLNIQLMLVQNQHGQPHKLL